MSKRLSLPAIEATAMPQAASLLREYFPSGIIEGQEFIALNPNRDDSHTGSFKFNLKTGLWQDFAIGKSGTGFINYLAYTWDVSASVAAARLKGRLQSSNPHRASKKAGVWQVVVPVPESAPKYAQSHYQHGKAVKHWEYLDPNGALLCVMSRFDTSEGKVVLPQALHVDTHGNMQWRYKALAAPRPLYGLADLASRSNAPVLVVEGEKTADAAAQIFPQYVVVTSSGGAHNAKHTDWTPLAGRTVTIWPDNDLAGQGYAKDIVTILANQHAMGAKCVCIPHEFPDKWDLADSLPLGWTRERLLHLLKEASTLAFEPVAQAVFTVQEPNQADILVRLAKGATLFRTPEGSACLNVVHKNRSCTWYVSSDETKDWLGYLFWTETGSACTPDAMAKALSILRAKALFEGDEHAVYIRVGEFNGCTYIDLADDRGQVVEIGKHGWKISDQSPIYFLRRKGMLALPTPVRDGSLDILRPFVNADDNGYVLIVSWLLMAMRGRGPYPMLFVTGEQGTAKSTLLQLLRKLIDPNTAPLRTLPDSIRDLFISARNAWVLGFDNLSYLKGDVSDALCRISTGGGYATRQLHANDSEELFEAMRPMMMNGIANVVTRPDLGERSLVVTLQPISREHRKTDREIWGKIDPELPSILGALLDIFVQGLVKLPDINLTEKDRMADFAVWGTACAEAAFGDVLAFATAIEANQQDMAELAVAGSPVADAIIRSMVTFEKWEGTATALLALILPLADQDTVRSKVWPKNARALSSVLTRLGPALRRVGLDVYTPSKQIIGLHNTKFKKLAPGAPLAPTPPPKF